MVHTRKIKNVKDVYYNLDEDGNIEVELFVNNEQIISKTFPNVLPFVSFNYAKKLAKEQNAKLHTMTVFREETEKFNKEVNK
jgi:hypothetical protein